MCKISSTISSTSKACGWRSRGSIRTLSGASTGEEGAVCRPRHNAPMAERFCGVPVGQSFARWTTCAIVTAQVTAPFQEANDGSKCSVFIHGATSVRGCVEHFRKGCSTIRTGRHRNHSEPGNHFRYVKSSRKYPNLIARPICSFVVGWAGEQTVQLEGVATEPKGPDLKRYQEMYFSVWPDGSARMSWPDIAYLVVRPRWIRYSDYDQVPPVIEEITLDD
jgi:hypothetical protein